MRITRILSGIVCLIGIALFLYAIPVFYVELRDHCIDQVCEAYYDTPPSSAWLESHNLNSTIFAGAYTSLYTLFGIAYIGVGIIVFRKKSKDLVGQVASVALILQGFSFNSLSHAIHGLHPVLDRVLLVIEGCSFIALMTLFFIFPNGRFNPRWTRYLLIVILIPGLLRALFPNSGMDLQQESPSLFLIWVLFWMGSLIAVQIYRYRKVLDPLERQQTKWAVAGMSAGISGLLLITIVYLVKDDFLNRHPQYLFMSESSLSLCMMLIPITLLFALLRRKLWEIDPLVNRTIMFGTLSLFVIAFYIAVVWYIGELFPSESQWLNSLVATGLVAILFAPAKDRLQRLVNRMMYGENDDPLAVLARLGRRLENPLSPHDALSVVVRTVREALKLPYSGMELHQNGDTFIVAEDGDSEREPIRLPLVHRGVPLGNLLVASRSLGETFSLSDQRFLDMLVRQAGAVVQSAKSSIDLHLIAEDLKESRERLVLAREEERRRLRRNLHDDLAPRLAALALTASAAETLLSTDPSVTRSILVELQTVIRSTVTDIRRLVHDLRPPALDELGLIGAIQERINDLSRPLKPSSSLEADNETAEPIVASRLQFRLYAPVSLPSLPAAVEVAAFRIVTEAIVNVVRHAGATLCEVSIRMNKGLEIEILDNGQGLSEKRERSMSGGIGLHSMRERAEELGGYCLIEPSPDIQGGTKVLALLPINELEIGSAGA